MERIEALIASGVQAHYRTAEGEGWLPSLPYPMHGVRYRLADAWAVLTGKATAVQWPHQREERG